MQSGKFKQIHFGLGNEMYVTGCCKCGAPVKSWIKRYKVKFTCKKCKEAERESSLKKQITELTKQRRIEAAKEIISNQGYSLEEYEHAFEVVQKIINKHDNWFQSINEVLVAAELIRMKVKANHQVKINQFWIDFILPDVKVALEIDGYQHNESRIKEKDKLKETAIITAFGPKWEVVRIKDSLIKRDVQKLIPAIKEIVQKRRKMRKIHNGQLPYNYSSQI